jgi:hypothetical protein
MKALNVMRLTRDVTLITLTGIAVATTTALLIQTVSATDVMNITKNLTMEEALVTGNNNTNVILGNLVYRAKTLEETYNPINETNAVISYMYSVTLMPPNATATGAVINATETGNFTVNNLPNGLSINQGQGLIITEDDDGGGQEERAAATFVSLARTNPDGIGSGTSVVYFSTNSTGQLAFLNDMIGIAQVELSPEGTTVRIWEWKGGTLPSQNEG